MHEKCGGRYKSLLQIVFSKENLLYSACEYKFFSVKMFLSFQVGIHFINLFNSLRAKSSGLFSVCQDSPEAEICRPSSTSLFTLYFFFNKSEMFSLCGFATPFFFFQTA